MPASATRAGATRSARVTHRASACAGSARGRRTRTRSSGAAGSRLTIRAATVAFPHAQPILDVAHARHRFSDVFGATFVMAVVHRPGKRDLGAVYRDLDFRSVESVVLRQPFVDVFPDAVIETTVALWTTPGMRFFATSLFCVFVAKPRRYRISGSIEPAALFALIFAAALVPFTLVAAIAAAPSLSFALAATTAIVIVAASAGLAASTTFLVTLAGADPGWIVVSL